jgi:hypothetical protein
MLGYPEVIETGICGSVMIGRLVLTIQVDSVTSSISLLSNTFSTALRSFLSRDFS